ncbi:serine hydrolase [Microbacterium sp. NPDC019599]|uniref:serine hydrolase domain-containing protein n=1 Tax=Microbacterium sp. NPDC019599 TaxID=3154690 RepID=UPI0033EDEE63
MTHLLPRSRPQAQGVPAAAIARFVRALDDIPHVHTLTIARHGHVVAEFARPPYERDAPHALYSVSKSFTAIAVGLAIDERRFGLDDRVVDLLADLVPQHPSPRLEALRVRHLLTMTTGHDAEPWAEDDDWARGILTAELAFEPGTHWLYNTPATHLLSQIVQTRTGERLLDYLTPRLFEPLGIVAPTWLQNPVGVDAGGFGLSLRVEELAAFGQLLLQRGRWNDRQLVPAEWIDQATSRQVANGTPSGTSDWDQGYGFQFWMCRHGAYRADGAFGQYVVVLPEHDAVVTMTGGLADMALPLEALWEIVLPALDTVGEDAEVPAPRPIAPSGGERRDIEAAFEYDGPIRRLCVSATVLEIDGLELRFAPDGWVVGSAGPLLHRNRVYGDHVALSGGWQADTFVALLRALEDAVTFRLELTSEGRLTITRDVGFEGTHVWEGAPSAEPDQSGSAAVDHHSVVSP